MTHHQQGQPQTIVAPETVATFYRENTTRAALSALGRMPTADLCHPRNSHRVPVLEALSKLSGGVLISESDGGYGRPGDVVKAVKEMDGRYRLLVEVARRNLSAHHYSGEYSTHTDGTVNGHSNNFDSTLRAAVKSAQAAANIFGPT